MIFGWGAFVRVDSVSVVDILHGYFYETLEVSCNVVPNLPWKIILLLFLAFYNSFVFESGGAKKNRLWESWSGKSEEKKHANHSFSHFFDVNFVFPFLEFGELLLGNGKKMFVQISIRERAQFCKNVKKERIRFLLGFTAFTKSSGNAMNPALKKCQYFTRTYSSLSNILIGCQPESAVCDDWEWKDDNTTAIIKLTFQISSTQKKSSASSSPLPVVVVVGGGGIVGNVIFRSSIRRKSPRTSLPHRPLHPQPRWSCLPFRFPESCGEGESLGLRSRRGLSSPLSGKGTGATVVGDVASILPSIRGFCLQGLFDGPCVGFHFDLGAHFFPKVLMMVAATTINRPLSKPSVIAARWRFVSWKKWRQSWGGK